MLVYFDIGYLRLLVINKEELRNIVEVVVLFNSLLKEFWIFEVDLEVEAGMQGQLTSIQLE
jgi:hypothetical protein